MGKTILDLEFRCGYLNTGSQIEKGQGNPTPILFSGLEVKHVILILNR